MLQRAPACEATGSRLGYEMKGRTTEDLDIRSPDSIRPRVLVPLASEAGEARIGEFCRMKDWWHLQVIQDGHFTVFTIVHTTPDY